MRIAKSLVRRQDAEGERPVRLDEPIAVLQQEMNRLFSDFFRPDFGLFRSLSPVWERSAAWQLWPRVDVTENDRELRVTAELPGLEEKDIEVTVSDGVLLLRGQKRRETQESKDDGKENLYYSERSYGEFERRVELPVPVNADRAEARFERGVLTITLPKAEEAQTRRIPVRAS